MRNHRQQTRYIAIVGNPNSGKTTLFNSLTGLRQKVGNYPGVTVEKKEGRINIGDGIDTILIDLPGTYSLNPNSPDEKIATDIILGRATHSPSPHLVVYIVNASNIERNLYFATQIIDRNVPAIVVLNMIDVAEEQGIHIDNHTLERELGVPVIPTVGNKGIGLAELKRAISNNNPPARRLRQWSLPEPVLEECHELAGMLRSHHKLDESDAFHEAVALLTSPSAILEHMDRFAPEIIEHVRKDHQKLDFLGFDRQSVFVESRYAWIKQVCSKAVTQSKETGLTTSDKIDRIVTHRVWGVLLFFALMAAMFQSVFSWASIPMQLIGTGFNWMEGRFGTLLPPGDVRDLVLNGGLAGVAAVVTFLPQILLLFLFLGLLEDSGYMARAAFIMDRVMSKVGLHGKSFIPLLSSFACAIPGIMATRTIESPKDRIATMLVAPLMSCSARLPVYTLLIAAFIPKTTVFGVFSLAGITLLSMYFLGLVTALTMAWLFKKTLLIGDSPMFMMELPPYRRPSLKSLLILMWERSVLFLKNAGTIILGVSIILWFLASYPKLEHAAPSQQLEQSFAGHAGRAIEPLIKPLGFDWKIGIGLVTSLLQREVFVSTMGTIYNIQDKGNKEGSLSLQERLRQDRDPVTGAPTFTTLTAICVMVYYMLAMQCLSTVAIMRRETNGWKWPLFQIGYMTVLAYTVTFLVYRVGLWWGLGG